MTEEWKDIVGYSDLFQISNHGRFYSKRTERILKLNPVGDCKKGYLAFSTRVGGRLGKSILFKAHQEVAKAFLEYPEGALDYVVNHIDGDKHNNNSNNLEWCSQKDNSLHFSNSDDGLASYKVRNIKTAKLTDEQVRGVRAERLRGVSQRVLAKKYKVSRTSINNAIKGYKWVV